MRVLWRRPLQVAGILTGFLPALVVVLLWHRAQEGPGTVDLSNLPPQHPPSLATPAGSGGRQGPKEDPTLPIRKEVLDAAARAEGLEALRRMKLQWRLEREAELRAEKEGRVGCGHMPAGRFVRMSGFHEPEIDLFARGYPELSQEWAKAATESRETADWERAAALTCLGALWSAGWASAALALVPICRSQSPWEADYALWRLGEGDVSGRYRPLYLELAKAGQPEALEALAYGDDPEAVTILVEAETRWLNLPAPKGSHHLVARELLPRLRAFAAGTWEELAKKAIREEPGPVFRGDIAWALRVAAERRSVWLEEVLRQRMSQAYLGAAVHFTPRERPRTDDDAYDDVILTLARIGGALTDDERRYLVHFGYCCEPRERLGEVLREKNYAR